MIRRDLRPDERHIVRTQWKRTLTPKHPFAGRVHAGLGYMLPELWARACHAVIDDLMRRGQCEVVCDEESPEVILGWVCWDTHGDEVRVHYVYTSPKVRRRGLGRFLLAPLLEHQNVVVTCLTKHGKGLLASIDHGHPALAAEEEARLERERRAS